MSSNTTKDATGTDLSTQITGSSTSPAIRKRYPSAPSNSPIPNAAKKPAPILAREDPIVLRNPGCIMFCAKADST